MYVCMQKDYYLPLHAEFWVSPIWTFHGPWWNPWNKKDRVSSWSGWVPPSSQRSHANPVVQRPQVSVQLGPFCKGPGPSYPICIGAVAVSKMLITHLHLYTCMHKYIYIYIYMYICVCVCFVYLLIYLFIRLLMSISGYIKFYLALLIGSCATSPKSHPCRHLFIPRSRRFRRKAHDGRGCRESSRTSRRRARHTTGNVGEAAWLRGISLKKNCNHRLIFFCDSSTVIFNSFWKR